MFARILNKDEWQRYRNLRMEALAAHEDVYGISLADEQSRSEQYWIDLFSDSKSGFFGLFDCEDMVGIAAVFTERTDMSGKTALMASAYIRPAYRGRGLSRLLYEARIEWIEKSDRFERIVIAHREGNESSRRANQRFGFINTGAEETTWGDGSTGIKHIYELRVSCKST